MKALSLLKTTAKTSLILLGITFIIASVSAYTIYAVGEHIATTAQDSTDPEFVPQDGDILVSFAGSDLRHYYTEKLYVQANCHWVISDPRDTIYKDMILKGYDPETLTPVYTGVSTYTEVVGIDAALALIQEQYKTQSPSMKHRIIFISTPGHLARIKLIVGRLVDIEDNTEVLYHGLPQSWLSYPDNYYAHWWEQAILRDEVKKYIGYFFLYWW